MILADTSIWVAHLRQPGGHPELIAALEEGTVSTHPFVEGELLLGGGPVDELLGGVARLPVEPHREVLGWIRQLARPVQGIGWVDAHLVYSALVHQQRLMTLDRRLGEFYRGVARR